MESNNANEASEKFLTIFARLLLKNGLKTLLIAKYALFGHTIILKIFDFISHWPFSGKNLVRRATYLPYPAVRPKSYAQEKIFEIWKA